MGKNNERYIPAFSYRSLTPLYDLFMRTATRESAFKSRLVERVGIRDGQAVLDIGCGTATLTILLKRSSPEAKVIGIDGDTDILLIARRKIKNTDLGIPLSLGMVFKLPYVDLSFDKVTSSMVLHHLTQRDKSLTLEEVFRILKPGGEIHIAELGKPSNPIMNLVSIIIGRLEEASDLVKGILPQMLHRTGFVNIEETDRFMTLVGTVSVYKAGKP